MASTDVKSSEVSSTECGCVLLESTDGTTLINLCAWHTRAIQHCDRVVLAGAIREMVITTTVAAG